MANTGRRVIITGGSGFIGACLARDLIAAGNEVHLLLRRESANLWRLAGLEGQFVAHWTDLRDAGRVSRAMDACRPQIIYHLATHGAYPSQRDRSEILATNLLGTANLLTAAAACDYERFIHVGSSSEYGHKPGPMKASDRLEPRTDYAVGKASATLLCQAEAFQGRPVTTVRVFSAYGPWEEPSRLVPYVMGCCQRGEAPRVTAGRQPRDFIFVEDVVALLKVAAGTPRAAGSILHAGTGRQHTVREMIETIVAVCGRRRIQPAYGAEPLRADEPSWWQADIEETRALTGWVPQHSLETGIQMTWDWYRAVAPALAA